MTLHHPDQGEPRRHVELAPASGIRPKRAKWLWTGRVPLGEITLVAGREGAGKSTFLAWMVRAITRGELEGEFFGQPRGVLYAAAEDSWAHTIVPRLIAAGADLDLVYGVKVYDEKHGTSPVKVMLPQDTAAVLKAGHDAGAVVLMLDPGLSFLDDKIDTFKTPEVRPALEDLRRLAERYAQAVLMLSHFNKSSGTDVLTKIAGARAFAEVARAALAVAVDDSEDDEDEDRPAQRDRAPSRDSDERTVILSQAKNNLGRMNLPNLTYVIRDAVVETDEGDAHVGRLHWTGESQRTAEQALNGQAARKRNQAPPGDIAQQILDFVGSKFRPVSSGEIEKALPHINSGTLRKELRRLLDRGLLCQPEGRGSYSLSAPVGGATSATSATTPGQPTSRDRGLPATSATSEVNEVAVVADVADVAGHGSATNGHNGHQSEDLFYAGWDAAVDFPVESGVQL